MTEVEWVDVVDGQDHVIGRIPRPEIRATRSNHRVVHVLLLDRQDRLILQRPARHLAKEFELGSTVAGHVRAGESYEAAAGREVEEELGIVAPPLRGLGTTWLDEEGRRKFIGVFVGVGPRAFTPASDEVESLVSLEIREVRRLLRDSPTTFSETFRRVFRHADAARCFG